MNFQKILTYTRSRIRGLWKNLQGETVHSIFPYTGFPLLCADCAILHTISNPTPQEILEMALLFIRKGIPEINTVHTGYNAPGI